MKPFVARGIHHTHAAFAELAVYRIVPDPRGHAVAWSGAVTGDRGCRRRTPNEPFEQSADSSCRRLFNRLVRHNPLILSQKRREEFSALTARYTIDAPTSWRRLPARGFGPYVVELLIGSGGMGEVYRARDTRLRRHDAIKILPGRMADSRSRERFDREARAVAALSHPNIVTIYDVGTHDDTPYAATELLEGETLRSRIGTSPLPVRIAVDYAVQIARGLAAAHVRGIVHRDLKMLYEMVSARRAFSGDNRIETLHATLKEHPPNLAASGLAIPPALERLMMQCLEEAPEGRFQSARDLVFALENLTDAAAKPAGAQPVRPRRARRPAAAATNSRWVLAVLPFEKVTRDGGPGYFAAGMTDEVTSQLSKLSALRIVGRAAVAAFKSGRSDLPGMVKELGVGTLVTGTVREDGSRVRVTVELMDARSAQVIWSDQYDREGIDVFSAQSDIALRIAEALQATVTLEEQARVGKRPTGSVAAHQLFIQERSMRGRTRARLLERIAVLNQAIALDSQFALAYARIAEHYQFLASFGDTAAPAKRIEAAHTALAIDPQLAQAHHALGLGTYQAGRLMESLAALQKATILDPNFSSAHVDFANALGTAGRFDEALQAAKRTLPLIPNQPTAYYHVGMHLMFLDEDSRAERLLAAAAMRFPAVPRLQYLRSYVRPPPWTNRCRTRTQPARGGQLAQRRRSTADSPRGCRDCGVSRREEVRGGAAGGIGRRPNTADLALGETVVRVPAAQGRSEGRRVGADDQVLAASDEAIKGGADWLYPRIQIATVHATRGDVSTALDWLERTYESGWRDPRIARMLPMWVPLRHAAIRAAGGADGRRPRRDAGERGLLWTAVKGNPLKEIRGFEGRRAAHFYLRHSTTGRKYVPARPAWSHRADSSLSARSQD